MVDREGRATALPGDRGPYLHPRLTRDGNRLAVAVESESGADIWIHDVQRGTRQRLTSGGVNGFPLWSSSGAEESPTRRRPVPDASACSRAISRPAVRPNRCSRISRPAPLEYLPGGMASLLPGTMPRPGSANSHVPMSWSADGRHLAFDERKPGAQRDVWVLTRGGDPAPFVLTAFDEWSPAFSPDGNWLAYVRTSPAATRFTSSPTRPWREMADLDRWWTSLHGHLMARSCSIGVVISCSP